MRYVSTRGEAPPQGFEEVLLAGLAPDGGLYLPEKWPQIGADEIASFAHAPYADVAFRVLSKFTGGEISREALKQDIDAAYATFDQPGAAPLVEIDPGIYLLELFHGPTLAFKDIAMQVLGRLFARALSKRGKKATILAATSGDTGSAAISALGGLPNIELFVLHPKGRVSDVQRRQMTTDKHANVHNIALEGSFDDAQSIVKSLFSDRDFVAKTNLTAVNSINFARIAAQTVYYFTAAAQLARAPVFIVPTGNFGDVFAGEAAMRMGLPVEKLIVATNSNDILVRALNDGIYAAGRAQATLSPSMDIQVASNFERALFEASGRDSRWTRGAMSEFARTGALQIPPGILSDLRGRYEAYGVTDEETLEVMAGVHQKTGRLVDPHTAVALAAAAKMAPRTPAPIVVLATAHPAKFPESVARATGVTPPLPPRLAGLYEGEERVSVLPHDGARVRAFIEAALSHS
jgi:threonine synthase